MHTWWWFRRCLRLLLDRRNARGRCGIGNASCPGRPLLRWRQLRWDLRAGSTWPAIIKKEKWKWMTSLTWPMPQSKAQIWVTSTNNSQIMNWSSDFQLQLQLQLGISASLNYEGVATVTKPSRNGSEMIGLDGRSNVQSVRKSSGEFCGKRPGSRSKSSSPAAVSLSIRVLSNRYHSPMMCPSSYCAGCDRRCRFCSRCRRHLNRSKVSVRFARRNATEST